MKDEGRNIYSVFDEILTRQDKEVLLKQRGIVIWLTGLSGSGKTTIAKALERKFHQDGFLSKLLDGDNVRTGINSNLGFTEEDRSENIRRIAEVSRLFLDNGTIVICSFVSPTKKIRALARQIVGEQDFFEVFINTPLEVCERRDVKGLYEKARMGDIPNFTGISAPFESPEEDYIEILTENTSVEKCAQTLFDAVIDKIKPA